MSIAAIAIYDARRVLPPLVSCVCGYESAQRDTIAMNIAPHYTVRICSKISYAISFLTVADGVTQRRAIIISPMIRHFYTARQRSRHSCMLVDKASLA